MKGSLWFKSLLIATASIIILTLTGCDNSSVTKVKESYASGLDMTVGQFLDNRLLCLEVDWNSFKDKFDRTVVQYQCKIKNSKDFLNIRKLAIVEEGIHSVSKGKELYVSRIEKLKLEIEGTKDRLTAAKNDPSSLESAEYKLAVRFQNDFYTLNENSSIEEFRSLIENYSESDLDQLPETTGIRELGRIIDIAKNASPTDRELNNFSAMMSDISHDKVELDRSVKELRWESFRYLDVAKMKIEISEQRMKEDLHRLNDEERLLVDLKEERSKPKYAKDHYIYDSLEWTVSPDNVVLTNASVSAKKSGSDDYPMFEYSSEFMMYRKMFYTDEVSVGDYLRASNYSVYKIPRY